jgi:hypothetical protein
MKDIRIQIHRPKSLLTLGIVLLNATVVLGANWIPQPSSGSAARRSTSQLMNFQRSGSVGHSKPSRRQSKRFHPPW